MALPKDLKNLRACLICSLIKKGSQFVSDGCDNCDFIKMKGSKALVFDCTTTDYQGMIGLMDPKDSWTGKWQGISKYCLGLYAVTTFGKLPDDILEILKEKGIEAKASEVLKK